MNGLKRLQNPGHRVCRQRPGYRSAAATVAVLQCIPGDGCRNSGLGGRNRGCSSL